MAGRKPHLPMLIDSFPSPPSHLPPLPPSSFNPPPSLPPSAPLPPVPGPSRLTEADTLQLLMLSSRSNRSRRSSRYSVASGEGNRDSIVSTSSANSYAGTSCSPRLPSRMPSLSNRSSTASAPTSPRSFSRPSNTFSIHEERDDVLPPSVARHVVSPGLPLFDEDEDDDDVDDSTRGHSHIRRRRHHQANESISSINMRDILSAMSGGEEEDLHSSSKLNASLGRKASAPTLPSSHSHKSSLAYLKFDDIPPQASMDSTNSTSNLSLADLASASTATIRSPTIPSSPPISPIRSKRLPPQPPPLRSPSPDIDSIIQSTPKPARIGVRSFSMSTGSQTRTTPRPVRSVRSMRSIRGPADEFGALLQPMRLSKTSDHRKKSLSSDPDDSLDYIVGGVWDHGDPEADEKRLRRLEKELDGSGTESDDSSLDLHTPLPHLMVRHGLLSPNSKLLPDAESRSNTPYSGVDGRPGSIMSTVSTVSKSGVIKDQRDTVHRRVRHRDGKLLRGGIGLTTGLGWSDSEDEDAPSPLTKRLSTLNLSNRSSTASTHSHRTHPLSRAYSRGTLHDDFVEEEDEEGVDEWGVRHTKSTSNAPTAWARKMSGTSASTRTSVASSNGRLSTASSTGRYSYASNGSAASYEGRQSEDFESFKNRGHRPRGSGSSGESALNNDVGTHSSGSTLSIPLPVTPQHDQPPALSNSINGKRPTLGKNKALPPLPGALKKSTSKVNPPPVTPVKPSYSRARTLSSASSTASVPSPSPAPPLPPQTPNGHVRPLQLPRQIRTSSVGDRPAVPVPSITSRTLRKASLPATTSPAAPPQTPVPARSLSASTSERPKPRTGTGMMYKTSSMSSKLRPPMPLQSSALSTSSIGRPRQLMTRPTAI